ncbi:MAG TPA: trypsin-like peptidase domain-containing protein [Candidatus Paceibacterota bacterium]|nr:trypsin-like peptidase domain-containing protein [Candidatus Paceibacterota bacterium]
MQEFNILKLIKKTFTNKDFVSAFFVSLLCVLLIIAAGLPIVWHYRANIFGYFAKEYLQEAQAGSGSSADAEKIMEKQTIFSQEHFVIDAVKKTNPAVVSIIISKEVPKYETYIDPNQDQNPFGDMFPDFPGFNFNMPQYRQNGTEKKEIGGGSGFFVSSDGLIVTNKHVVDQKDVEYTVFTNDGKKHIAKVVARDPILDIALIKIEGSNYPSLTLGNSDSLEVGQDVIAIGNALGEFRNTVSVGVVSGLARSLTAGDFSGNTELLDHVIQTDAAINPGNSGGPLLDLSGRVVGVNVAVAQGSQNVGFALPINSVKGAIESVKSTGKIVRPYLGVRYVAIDADMKEKNNLTVDYGVLVKAGGSASELAVIPGSPADKAGIVENDIILEVDGVKLDDKTNLAAIIRTKNIGQVVNLKVLHRGVQINVPVTLEAAKDN